MEKKDIEGTVRIVFTDDSAKKELSSAIIERKFYPMGEVTYAGTAEFKSNLSSSLSVLSC